MTSPLDLQAERFTATGNITSEGMRNQLGRPRLDRLAVLVRESAQNAWDAQAPDSPCVRFGVACYELSRAQVAYSGRTWATIPAGLGQRFRSIWARTPEHLGTDSGAPGHGFRNTWARFRSTWAGLA